MISQSRLLEKFMLDPDFTSLVFQGSDPAALYTNDQAARLLALYDVFMEWRSISRQDLLKLFKDLEWAFKNPPSMTYDKVLSRGVLIQFIPKQYLMRIELAKENLK